ncbi:hypothetical protein IAD21_05238 [Abditibacteriota bacterium]|nr:hypothetical protein IAD21_05238 [Abditibacteriota bacterium]
MKEFKKHSVWFLFAGAVALMSMAGCSGKAEEAPTTAKAPANYIPGQPVPDQVNAGKANTNAAPKYIPGMPGGAPKTGNP